MATIMNHDLNLEPRIFDHEKVNNFERDMMMESKGGMAPEIEENLLSLAEAAKLQAKKKKKIKIYDWNTNNKSFLELHRDLKNLGITNNKFFLRIYDPDLKGVDVYKDVLPIDMQLKVLLEVMINPWYFLREVCRIPVDGKAIDVGGGTAFIADRNNVASWYCFLNGIDHYDSKSRQLGKTQNAIAELNYAYHFGALSATFLFFNKDFALAKQNLYRLKCQRDMLPPFLQMKLAYHDDGTVDKGQDNVTTMRNPITNNVIKVQPKATGKDAAVRLGRGDTASFHYMDEFDFLPWNLEIMKSAAFSFSTASKNAKANHSLYGRILTSTPGYLNTPSGKDASNWIDRMLFWDDHFYDMPIGQLKGLVESTKYNKFIYVEHSWKQLKKPQTWYEEQCGLVDYDPDTILREIELKRIQGNEKSPFKKEMLAYISQHVKEPLEVVDYTKKLDNIFIFEKLNKKYRYILSVDPAEGLGQNNNAFTLINPYTLEVAAEYKSPYISPGDFTTMICDFIKDKCPKSLIVIEANRGREIINRILETRFKYQLYYSKDKLDQKVVANTDKYGEQKRASNERRAFGMDTTPKSKSIMWGIIERMMREEIHKVNTPFIVKDVTCIERTPTGAIKMGAGDDSEGEGHGDNLMSYLIGLFVYYNDPHIEDFGIFPGMSKPADEGHEETNDEKISKIQSIIGSLSPDMQELFGGVLKEKDPISSSYAYERQVQQELRQASALTPQSDDGDIYYANDDAMYDRVAAMERHYYTESVERYNNPSSQFNIEDWV